jgi:hypothetical protein
METIRVKHVIPAQVGMANERVIGWAVLDGPSWYGDAQADDFVVAVRLVQGSGKPIIHTPRSTMQTHLPSVVDALREGSPTGTFTRLDLQQTVEVSKAQANRMVAELLKQGVIQAIGSGRKTQYRFLSPL